MFATVVDELGGDIKIGDGAGGFLEDGSTNGRLRQTQKLAAAQPGGAGCQIQRIVEVLRDPVVLLSGIKEGIELRKRPETLGNLFRSGVCTVGRSWARSKSRTLPS